jgi:hypothetical protein
VPVIVNIAPVAASNESTTRSADADPWPLPVEGPFATTSTSAVQLGVANW